MEGLRAGEVLLYARRTAPGDRRAAWRLLEEALARRLGLAGLPPAAREERGRPYFPGLPGVRFSLSHSGPFCLCALAAGPVGADVEAVRPRGEVLLRRGLTEAERAWCLEEADPWPRFCLLWTRRESLGKYTGRGLALPVREMAVPLPPAEELDGLRFRSYAGEGWAASVCSAAPPPADVLWLPPEG